MFLGLGYSVRCGRWLIPRRVAVTAQAYIFLLLPLLTLLPAALIGAPLTASENWLALVVVAVLPASITVSEGFTVIARGDRLSAKHGASLSTTIALVLTPLLLLLLLGIAPELPGGGVAAIRGATYLGFETPLAYLGRVTRLIIAPAAIGQAIGVLLRRRLGERNRRSASSGEVGARHGAYEGDAFYDSPGAEGVRTLNRILALPLLFFALAPAGGSISSVTARALPLFGYVAIVQLVALAGSIVAASLLVGERPKRISFVFAVTQKSAVFGIPLVVILVQAHPRAVTPLLLILFSYLWQLVLAGAMESFYTREDR